MTKQRDWEGLKARAMARAMADSREAAARCGALPSVGEKWASRSAVLAAAAIDAARKFAETH